MLEDNAANEIKLLISELMRWIGSVDKMLAMQTWEPKFGFRCTLVIPVLRDTGKQRQKDSSGLTDKLAQLEQTALVPVRDSHLQETRTKRGTAHGKRQRGSFQACEYVHVHSHQNILML